MLEFLVKCEEVIKIIPINSEDIKNIIIFVSVIIAVAKYLTKPTLRGNIF